MAEYFRALAALVEETYAGNGGSKVVLVSHSLGSLITLRFLHGRGQAWKDAYVAGWVSASGLWGGSAQELEVFATGSTFGISSVVVDRLKMRGQQRTIPSNVWMLPMEEVGNWTVYYLYCFFLASLL